MNTTPQSLPPFIFDCDGVLVDSERLAHRISSEQCAKLGINIGFEELLGKTVKDVVSIIGAKIQREVPPEWIYEWAMATANCFVCELKPISGIQRLLGALQQKGHLIGVASQSQPPRLQLSLHVTGLAPYFAERVYSASQVAHPKPAPDIFLHAAASMGVDPQTCIVVEDSALGAKAAVAAGMKVYGYAAENNDEKLRAAGAEIIHSMDELLAIFAPNFALK